MSDQPIFSESQAEKWVGVRPALVGEQLYKEGTANNNTDTFYTVPVGKNFLLTHVFFNPYGTVGGRNSIIMKWQGGSTFYLFSKTRASGAVSEVQNASINPPLEFTSGDWIAVTSTLASSYCKASIIGYEVDAP